MFVTVSSGLDHWESVQNLGKRERTRQFNSQIVTTIRKHFPALGKRPEEITELDVLAFAQKVDHFCPSRWNTMLSALRSVTQVAMILKRRKLRFREFTAPTQEQFSNLLAELDASESSDGGQVVRFFTLTGLRFCEAKRLTWNDIGPDRVNVSASASKNGRARSIPFLPGLPEVISSLRSDCERVLRHPNVRRALKNACARIGIEPLSYHCLRHIFITRAVESGVDLPTVARWAGHLDGGALLARMYFHLVSDHSRAMAEKVRIF